MRIQDWAIISVMVVVTALPATNGVHAQAANSAKQQVAGAFQCPENFSSDAERNESLHAFLATYAAQHPNATIRDVMLARDRLLVSNGCTQTLRYMLAHISSIAQMLRFDNRSYDRAETGFDPKTHVWTVFFDPEDTAPQLADRGIILNLYSWNPPTSPADIAAAWASNKGSATNIYTFQAPDEVTKLPAYYIVSETMHADLGYGYANVSKVTALGAGAYAVTYDQKIAGKNAADIDKNIRMWLLTPDAKSIENAVASIGVDRDWQDALTRSH